ncbi:8527_t:CDS:1, partial [Gigaspora margarita]
LEYKEEANELELKLEKAIELKLELEKVANKMELELEKGVNKQESLSFISINSLD